MRLTRFTDYSLRVLIYLGQNNESRVTIHQISEAYDRLNEALAERISQLENNNRESVESIEKLKILF